VRAPCGAASRDGRRANGRREPRTAFSLMELRILASLAEGRTLANIAQAVCLGQPAVSKTLRAAERKAAIPLVERQGRRLLLTPAGAELAQAAQAVLSQEQWFEQLLADLRGGHAGTLRLLATSTPGNYVLPTVIGAFMQEVPQAQVVLQILGPGHIREVFLSETYDLAVYGAAPQTVQPRELLLEPLYDDPVTFFAAPGSPLARRDRVSWEDLRDETLIGPFMEPHWEQIVRQLETRGLAAARVIDLQGPEGVKRLVEAGGGIGVLFGAALRRELAEGRLRALPLAEPPPSRAVCLVRRRHAPLTPIARQFRAFLVGQLGDQANAVEGPYA